jgi:hypothetical protein
LCLAGIPAHRFALCKPQIDRFRVCRFPFHMLQMALFLGLFTSNAQVSQAAKESLSGVAYQQ